MSSARKGKGNACSFVLTLPPPPPGNLTSDQQRLLREMYRRLFSLYEQNTVSEGTFL